MTKAFKQSRSKFHPKQPSVKFVFTFVSDWRESWREFIFGSFLIFLFYKFYVIFIIKSISQTRQDKSYIHC